MLKCGISYRTVKDYYMQYTSYNEKLKSAELLWKELFNAKHKDKGDYKYYKGDIGKFVFPEDMEKPRIYAVIPNV